MLETYSFAPIGWRGILLRLGIASENNLLSKAIASYRFIHQRFNAKILFEERPTASKACKVSAKLRRWHIRAVRRQAQGNAFRCGIEINYIKLDARLSKLAKRICRCKYVS